MDKGNNTAYTSYITECSIKLGGHTYCPCIVIARKVNNKHMLSVMHIRLLLLWLIGPWNCSCLRQALFSLVQTHIPL